MKLFYTKLNCQSIKVSCVTHIAGTLETVDLKKLEEIEGTLNIAKNQMTENELDRKVSDLEKAAEKQASTIEEYNRDIETIVKDINNLEDIKKTLPSGCFNTPSIEKP